MVADIMSISFYIINSIPERAEIMICDIAFFLGGCYENYWSQGLSSQFLTYWCIGQ